MKTIRTVILMMITGLLFSSIAIAAKNKQPAKGRTLINLSLEEAGLEFQKLRKINGHFSGGKWLNSVDKWMGRKHQLMLHLQNKLTSKKADKDTITGILGFPDYILQADDPRASAFYRNALSGELNRSGNEVLIYNWRGSHDFLFFVIREKKQLKSDWWMAFE